VDGFVGVGYNQTMSDDRPWGPDQDTEGDELVITRNKPRTDKPPLYKVLLLNDDFTPMDFVILILKKFFMKSDGEASRIMLQVHSEGAGLAGVYTFEVAETKVYSVNEFSRRHKHPLKCIMEKE
jgi:ATP-dependent Clp protease adaptor protein ClpS